MTKEELIERQAIHDYSNHFDHRVIQPCWVCERDTVQEYDSNDQLYYCQECGAPQVPQGRTHC